MKKTNLIFATLITFFINSKTPYMSQPGINQDKYLNENIFKNKKNGVFIDIGAHDGKKYSNTYFFEKELGWTGICIEPIKEEFEKLKQNRSCICVETCVSDIEGKIQFILVDDKSDELGNVNMISGIYSTYGEKGLDRLQKSIEQYNVGYKIVEMNSRRLNNILEENKIYKIDYLSLDIEGAELLVLKDIDYDKFKIHVMSIENNFNIPDIEIFLKTKNFKKITTLDHDEIYINLNFK